MKKYVNKIVNESLLTLYRLISKRVEKETRVDKSTTFGPTELFRYRESREGRRDEYLIRTEREPPPRYVELP